MLITLCTVLIVSISYSVLISLLARKLIIKCADQNEKLTVVLNVSEHALDVLDSCYKNLVNVSSTPVLYDNIEIRQLCAELINSREAVLDVAKNITNVIEDISEE